MSKQDKLLLLGVILFCIALVSLSFFWSANKYYTKAYTPAIERSNERRKAIEAERKASGESSEQPRPAGFAEKDIKKQKGDRYSTY